MSKSYLDYMQSKIFDDKPLGWWQALAKAIQQNRVPGKRWAVPGAGIEYIGAGFFSKVYRVVTANNIVALKVTGPGGYGDSSDKTYTWYHGLIQDNALAFSRLCMDKTSEGSDILPEVYWVEDHDGDSMWGWAIMELAERGVPRQGIAKRYEQLYGLVKYIEKERRALEYEYGPAYVEHVDALYPTKDMCTLRDVTYDMYMDLIEVVLLADSLGARLDLHKGNWMYIDDKLKLLDPLN